MNINITCSIIHLIICVNFKFCTKFYFKVIIDCRSIATRQNRIAILYRYWAGFTFRCHITANVYFTDTAKLNKYSIVSKLFGQKKFT